MEMRVVSLGDEEIAQYESTDEADLKAGDASSDSQCPVETCSLKCCHFRSISTSSYQRAHVLHDKNHCLLGSL